MLPNLAALRVDDPNPTGVSGLWKRARQAVLGDTGPRRTKLGGLPSSLITRIIQEVWEHVMRDDTNTPVLPWEDPCELIRALCSTKLDEKTFVDRPWAQDKNVKTLLQKLNNMVLGDVCSDEEVASFLFEKMSEVKPYSTLRDFAVEDVEGPTWNQDLINALRAVRHEYHVKSSRPTTYEWWWRYWKYLPKQYPLPFEKPADQSKMEYLVGLCDAYAKERAFEISMYLKNPEKYEPDVSWELERLYTVAVGDRARTHYSPKWTIDSEDKYEQPFRLWMYNDVLTVSFLLNNMGELHFEVPSSSEPGATMITEGPLTDLLPLQRHIYLGDWASYADKRRMEWWKKHASRVVRQVLMIPPFGPETILRFLAGLKSGRLRPTRVHMIDVLTVLLRLDQSGFTNSFPLEVEEARRVHEMFPERRLDVNWSISD